MSCKSCGAQDELVKLCKAEGLKTSFYLAVPCSTCQESFVIRNGQVIEHQTERAHSGRMRTVHVISEEDRE